MKLSIKDFNKLNNTGTLQLKNGDILINSKSIASFCNTFSMARLSFRRRDYWIAPAGEGVVKHTSIYTEKENVINLFA